MKIISSNNPEALRLINADATVEAEYGDNLVSGRLVTMAHHGRYTANPAPCNWPTEDLPKPEDIGVVGVSHLDLDSIGGIMRLQGKLPENDLDREFWQLAEHVDVKGPHRIEEFGASQENIDRLNAYWAFAQTPEGRYFPPSVHPASKDREGDTLSLVNQTNAILSSLGRDELEEGAKGLFLGDATDAVEKHIDAIEKVLSFDKEMMDAGAQFQQRTDKLNKDSFVGVVENGSEKIALRHFGGFTNMLYNAPDGTVCDSVLSLGVANERFPNAAITLSYDRAGKGNAMREMQAADTLAAGGRDVIAGSDRSKNCHLSDMVAVALVQGCEFNDVINTLKESNRFTEEQINRVVEIKDTADLVLESIENGQVGVNGEEAIVKLSALGGINWPITSTGDRLIHQAASHDDCYALEKLIKSGASTQVVNLDGESPLHYCSGSIATGIVAKVDPNMVSRPDNDGKTPLFEATLTGDVAASKALLENGAQVKEVKNGSAKQKALLLANHNTFSVAEAKGQLKLVSAKKGLEL